MPLILTNDNYVLLESPSESIDICEIKSTTGSPIHQQTISKSSSSSRSMPTISSPFIQGWLRRQLIPVIIRSKVNDSKSSWKGSVDLSTATSKTNANEYTNITKLSTTINNNNNLSNCAINNLTNNLNSGQNCLTPNHQSPVKSKLIDNNLELQSQSAPCTPKFMMKRPPPLETIYSTPMVNIDTLTPTPIGCGEIDYLSRQLTFFFLLGVKLVKLTLRRRKENQSGWEKEERLKVEKNKKN